MKINLKQRLHNKTFVISIASLIIAFVYDLLAMFNIVPSVSQDSITNTVMMLIKLVFALGIVVDPTTTGISDSARALTYGTSEDPRRIDENDEGEINE